MVVHFTLSQANRLIPEVRGRMADLLTIKRRLEAEIADHPLERGVDGFRSVGAFALNDELHAALRWFRLRGIQIKGLAPPLVDFPARHGQEDVLLCWQAGEDHIEWYHRPEDGFAGRRPISDLEA